MVNYVISYLFSHILGEGWKKRIKIEIVITVVALEVAEVGEVAVLEQLVASVLAFSFFSREAILQQ